jgi:hypothetical protein
VSAWSEQPLDEASLFNPAFCGVLLNRVAEGHHFELGSGLPFALAFVALPLVLNQSMREELPHSVASVMSAWLLDRPDIPLTFPEQARWFVPVTKQALLFACQHGLIGFERTRVLPASKVRVAKALLNQSDDLRDSLNRAAFVGRWFARAGDAQTIMAHWGVAP